MQIPSVHFTAGKSTSQPGKVPFPGQMGPGGR